MVMEFFRYHRDRPGSLALREELVEEHWSYMDRYAKELIARGPTFADDGETPTGSVGRLGPAHTPCGRPGRQAISRDARHHGAGQGRCDVAAFDAEDSHMHVSDGPRPCPRGLARVRRRSVA